jgi:cysteine-S-conjugate beta-lyase
VTRKETKLVGAGRKPAEQFGAVNTPVYRASTILFPDARTMLSEGQPYIYGRRATPTTRALEEAVCALEGGARTVLTPSGLSACTLAILAACGAGDHLLLTDSCYGPTRHFCEREAKRFGIETAFFEPLIGAGITQEFRPNTKAIFVESPGSHTFEVQDVPAIAAEAKKRGIAVILDNTWATPLYFDALGHGVDLSVQAGTKYLGGHADVNLGTVTANAVHKDRLVETHGSLGLTSNGDESFLALRGLRTLAVRLKRHQETALELATWLARRPEVARVLYPALPDDPGHALWRRDFTGATGLFGVVLKPASQAAIAAMLDGMKLFSLGYSWGGFESLIVPSRFHRTYKNAAEGPIIRIHAGLEDADDLKADLAAGLERLARTA